MKQKQPTFTQFASACALSMLIGGVGYVVIANLATRRPHGHSGPRDGTQVRNLVQACFTFADSHQQHDDPTDASADALRDGAVVDPGAGDLHQPPAK